MIGINLENLILATDSYKIGHYDMYPEGTERVYSYFEARNGAKYDSTLFFGLQGIIKKYLMDIPESRDVGEACNLLPAHFGRNGFYNAKGWGHIQNLGYLPLRIKAVPEGTVVPNSNVLMTIENTDNESYWLTNALESLLVHVWYPSTVATLSYETLKVIEKYVVDTGGDKAGVPFMLHDFGYRGASSHESAMIGGAAHLLNSRGTDTLPGMLYAKKYYNADYDTLGFSVPATEHSVMTSLGKDGEMKIVDQLLDNYPEGILSVVADSYDITNFVNEIGTTFKDRILARDGVFVVRPDSLRNENDTSAQQMVDISEQLWNLFGGRNNGKKAYRVLNDKVRILWGDGIGPDGIEEILMATKKAGFAAENYVFGMGGGLLQKVNRDTQRFAFKCAAQQRRGAWFDISKNPLDTTKRSKAGRMSLVRQPDGTLATTPEVVENDLLETVFENGKLVRDMTFDEVRSNIG